MYFSFFGFEIILKYRHFMTIHDDIFPYQGDKYRDES